MPPRISYQRLAIISSVLFLCGISLAFFSTLSSLVAGGEGKEAPPIIWMVAWIVVTLSTIPELIIDAGRMRPSGPAVCYHSRYGRSDTPTAWNWLQSTLFLAGSIGQIVRQLAYFYDDSPSELSYDEWVMLSQISWGWFVAAAILALAKSGCCRRENDLNATSASRNVDTAIDEEGNEESPIDPTPVPFKNDLYAANSLFLTGSALVGVFGGWCCAHDQFGLSFLIFMLPGFGCLIATGILWVVVDVGCGYCPSCCC